ncbi:LysR family transcriptional regulator [Ornithinimicrobium cerasi]|uniref:LysR family transcriptional regulator n=1 Tax=Ornithinimicrobium cerasi TaxID=2248773 RepID=UPI000F0091B9|nr:LysR family transcriptional regulator [Ornithinimicrobium cerasi]
MAIETRHLRCFLAVAETLHFGTAAERLHLAQPAVSKAVRQLERELGVELLRRTTRSVSLTAAGQVYAERAETMRDLLEQAGRAARDTADGRSGTLRLGVTGSATYGYLPQLARVAAGAMPDVRLRVRTEMLTPHQERALLEDRLDLGVLRAPLGSAELDHVVVRREPLVAVLPAGHPVAESDTVAVADLSGESFVTYGDETGSVVLRAVLAACADAGFVPRRPHQVGETSTGVALVAAGLGVALLPESARSLTLPGAVFRRLDTDRTVDLALAWPAARVRPVVARLLAALRDEGLAPTLDPTSHTDPSEAVP